MMKDSFVITITILLILIPSWNSIYPRELGKTQIQITGGVRWGSFKDFNENVGLKVGDLFDENLTPEPFNTGYIGNLGFSYWITENQTLLAEGAYELFKAHNKSHFMTIEGESLGIKNFPVYRIRNIPVSLSYLFYEFMGPFNIFAGSGLGFQWTRLVEKYPSYELNQTEGSEYTYSGSTLFFKISGGGTYHLSRHLSISIPMGYRYARGKEMRGIPVDLSGFTIGLCLNVR
jgi:hypothetical protein